MVGPLLPVTAFALLLQRPPPLGTARVAALPRSVPRMVASVDSETSASFASDEPSRSKCAFFRVIEPSSTSFKAWAADCDDGGIDQTLATVFGWPLAALQHGVFRAMFTDVGIDIYNIDGYTDGILSHRDLMWPHRDEVAGVLRARSKDGTIHINDMYAAKVFTADKYNMPVSFGSYNEVPLLFIKCGGDLDMDSSTYGRVSLENVLLFFNGDKPLKSNNLQSNQINFKTMFGVLSLKEKGLGLKLQGGATNFKPPKPAPPATPLEALEASGSYVKRFDGLPNYSAWRALAAWIALTLMAAISQTAMLLYKLATQVLCPAHWGKKED